MSLFKSRSGGSLFRFRALTGYLKILFVGSGEQKETPKGDLQNEMRAKYEVKNEDV